MGFRSGKTQSRIFIFDSKIMTTTSPDPDKSFRCRWCQDVPEFLPYHDQEWGFPVSDDVRLFEKISLEGFQSGLSWRTILNKREHFRSAFEGFDFHKIAGFNERDVSRLLKNEGIVRHRGKIEAVINNAQQACSMVEAEGSLAAFIWKFEVRDGGSVNPQTVSTSPESVALSKELKRRGWKFVGPTTVYAFMQAMGLVNDHEAKCVIRPKVIAARKKFRI